MNEITFSDADFFFTDLVRIRFDLICCMYGSTFHLVVKPRSYLTQTFFNAF